MSKQLVAWAVVDEDGRLVIPAELTERFGLKPGAEVRLEENLNTLRLHRPASHLSKVYVEPTDLCNLDCTMCMRHNWDESMGRMSEETFSAIEHGLREISPRPTVFFGGIGEPLYHPRTVEWVARAKQTGARVEVITNGTILTERRSRQLIEAGLDVLWVSIDGSTPEHFSDVRIGAQLPLILENLTRFSKMRAPGHRPSPEIGIAFVAMRRNIQDLPDVIRLGHKLKASRFSVSNVLPYTPDMLPERLYDRTLNDIAYMNSPWIARISLPKMNLDEASRDVFMQVLKSGCNVNFAGNSLSGANDVCNFIASGSMTIAWDGGVSPCWPLMHSHISYLHGKERLVRRHVVGNVRDLSLLEVWNAPEYRLYRQKVQGFEFAPCTFCGGCDLSTANEEDCLGNGFPACGGCLWSQGVIQCP